MPRPLSKRQKSILNYIKEFMKENSYPPTVRDIQSGCNISSTSVVDYNLQILQREGHLQRRREVSRGIELTGTQPEPANISYLKVPVVGSIAAGEPLDLIGADELGKEDFDQVEIPPMLTGGKENIFALKVKGESMIDALVGDGDTISSINVVSYLLIVRFIKLSSDIKYSRCHCSEASKCDCE